MAIYNPKSLKAEEFINHEEILDTIRYAQENKHNVALIDELLEKARPKKTDHGTFCAGLTHREASVLLACDIPEKVEQMYQLAGGDQGRLLWQPHCPLCPPLPVQLLYQRLRLLSLPSGKPTYHPQKSLPRRKSVRKSWRSRTWGTSVWPLKPGKIR